MGEINPNLFHFNLILSQSICYSNSSLYINYFSYFSSAKLQEKTEHCHSRTCWQWLPICRTFFSIFFVVSSISALVGLIPTRKLITFYGFSSPFIPDKSSMFSLSISITFPPPISTAWDIFLI